VVNTRAPHVEISAAQTAADVAACKTIFIAYAEALDFSISYQGFAAEMAALPGAYAPPGGALLLARVDGVVAGAVGLRPLADPDGPKGNSNYCEMKRLNVLPAFRGLGLGRQLATGIIAEGRVRGYDALRLDTIAGMVEARALYTSLGFFPIASYNDSPLEGAMFYQLPLS